MAPTPDNKKVEEAVNSVKHNYGANDSFVWDDNFHRGFHGDEAKNSLEALSKLTADEFKAAWDQLDERPEHEKGIREALADAAHDAKLDTSEYQDLIKSFAANDPSIYYNAKKDKEVKADKPDIAKTPAAHPLVGEENHVYPVNLQPPDGASESLILLVADTSDTMTWDLDTLGFRRPKEDAPTFSNELTKNTRASSVSGWSDIRDAHDTLKTQLDARHKAQTDKHKETTDSTADSKVTGDQLWKDLIKLAADAQAVLDVKLTDWKRDGDKLTNTHTFNHDRDPIVTVIFEQNEKDKKFYLSADAELTNYVVPLKDIVRKWTEKYNEAAKKFLKEAAKVDAPPPETPPTPPKTPATPGPPPGSASTPPPGSSSTPPPGSSATPSTQNTDYSALFKDALANSPDGKAATTPPPSADGSTPPGTQPGTTPTDNNNQQVLDEIDAAENRIRQNDTATPAVYNPGTSAGGYSGGGNVGGNSGGGGSSFDPSQLMMMSALQQAMQNRDKGNGGMQDDRGEPRRPRDPNTVTPAANTPGAPTAPGAPGAPGQPVVTADQTTPPPTNGKGLVNVTIPGLNGTQQVSPVVQDALTKAFSNPSGCDARAAYEGGPGQSTPGMPWKQITDAELRTGDIAQWGNRTAVVVMTDNGPQIIIDGKLGPMQDGHLVQFNPNVLPDSLGGEFGKFEGFFHPSGADLSTDGQAPPETKPADPPKVSAGAAPGVVPAATPRTGPSGEI